MSKSQFDETTLYLYQRFKSEFPEYPYLATIAPKFEKQLEFLATPKDDIKITRDSFSSLAEVAKAMDAEYIFIDVWATWCKPCLDEFAHIKPLKAFLDKNKDKIAILYLSYDENRTLDDIEKVVNFHNLEGFHIVGSELLKAELSKNISTEGIMMLPSYAVMDKDGKIVKKKTSRPSQWEDLEQELLEIINQ
jgi:thiol-disulfide isomerase/thioredoxin